MGVTVFDGGFKGRDDLGGVAEIVRAARGRDRPLGSRIGFGLLVRAGLPDASLEVREEALHLVVQVLRRRLEKTAACYWFCES